MNNVSLVMSFNGVVPDDENIEVVETDISTDNKDKIIFVAYANVDNSYQSDSSAGFMSEDKETEISEPFYDIIIEKGNISGIRIFTGLNKEAALRNRVIRIKMEINFSSNEILLMINNSFRTKNYLIKDFALSKNLFQIK